MKVAVLTSKTCPGCQQLKKHGILTNLGRVFRPLDDVTLTEHPLGELDHPKKDFGLKGTVRVKDGGIQKKPRRTGDGLKYFADRAGDDLGTPMFLLEDVATGATDSFYVEDLLPDDEEDNYVMVQEPWLGSRLIVKRIFRFYCRYQSDIPRQAEYELQRKPDEIEQRTLGVRDHKIVPDMEQGEFQERRWIHAFTKAREPELA